MLQVTAVCFNEKADGIISGGIDNHIKIWDLKHSEVVWDFVNILDIVDITSSINLM